MMPDFSHAFRAMRRNGFDPAKLPGWRMLCALALGKPLPASASAPCLPPPLPMDCLRSLASNPARRLES